MAFDIDSFPIYIWVLYGRECIAYVESYRIVSVRTIWRAVDNCICLVIVSEFGSISDSTIHR